MKATVCRRFGPIGGLELAKAAKALQFIYNRQATGKIVLKP